MIRQAAVAALFTLAACVASAQSSFEVATIKPTSPAWKSGRYITMQGHQFVASNHALKTLLAAAYNLTPNAITGGPGWVDSDHYDILAKPPGDVRPSLDQQMSMLRTLLSERFQVTFHREQKDFSIYALTVAKSGAKLKPGAEPSEGPMPLIFHLSAQEVTLPARNATMGELASVMQRSALDRPVLDRTGISGRYDFELKFTPDETLFGGAGLRGTAESTQPDLFAAIQQQLGLRLEATRGPIDTIVIDQVERPSAN